MADFSVWRGDHQYFVNSSVKECKKRKSYYGRVWTVIKNKNGDTLKGKTERLNENFQSDYFKDGPDAVKWMKTKRDEIFGSHYAKASQTLAALLEE
jgi:hypothetical protein